MTSRTFGKLQSAQPHMTRNRAQVAASGPTAYSPSDLNVDKATYAAILGDDVSSGGGGSTGSGTYMRAGTPVKGLRFVSGFIDLIVMFALFMGLAFLRGDPNPTASAEAETYAILAWFFLPALFYGILMEASPLQGTLGKFFTGTVVTDMNGDRISFGKALGRNLGKVVSGIVPAYIPYWMVLFTENNQTLHDKMAGTLVFRRGEGPGMQTAELFA